MIVKTNGKLFIGDTVHDFYPGSLFLIGPHIPHNFASTLPIDAVVPKRDLVIQFKKEWLLNCMEVFDEFKVLGGLFEAADSGLQFSEETARAVFPILNSMDSTTGAERLADFIKILGLLDKCPGQKNLGAGRYYVRDKGGSAFDKFKKVATFLENNLEEDISLEAAARHVNMSYKSFSNWFSECSGTGFRRFLNRMRINKSCEMLYLSQHSVQEICYKVGFNNISNFNKAFKTLTGHTPTEFREKALKNEIPNFLYNEFDEVFDS